MWLKRVLGIPISGQAEASPKPWPLSTTSPGLALHLIVVGEETGQLDEVLLKQVVICDEQAY